MKKNYMLALAAGLMTLSLLPAVRRQLTIRKRPQRQQKRQLPVKLKPAVPTRQLQLLKFHPTIRRYRSSKP